MRGVVLLAAASLAAGSFAAAGCASARNAPVVQPAASAFPGSALAIEPFAAFAVPSAAAPASLHPALDDAVAAANAQPAPAKPPEEPADPDRWRFEFAPFLWVPAIDGTIGVGQLESAMDLSFGDFVDTIADHGENVVTLHAEASNGTFGFFGEVMYLDLEGEGERTRTFGGQQIGQVTIPTRSVTIEAETGFTSTTAELGVSYVLGRTRVTGDVEGTAHAELLAGARWYDVETTVDLTPGPEVELEEEWLDPFVGLRASLPLGKTVALLVRGDLGGFDLGDASDLSYRVTALLRWDVAEHATVFFGWSLLDVDYETGDGRDAFVYDVRMSGPAAGVSLRF